MLIFWSCRNATERKTSCADEGICQVNVIKSHKYFSKLHRDPWWHKPAPLTWPSPVLEIHPGCTMKKNKNGDMIVLPPQDCLPSSNPNPWTNLVAQRHWDPMPESHTNHWSTSCLQAIETWLDPSNTWIPCPSLTQPAANRSTWIPMPPRKSVNAT